MKKNEPTFTSKILLYILVAGDLLTPFLDRRQFNKRFLYRMPYDSYRKTVYYLSKKV